jgi:hypothetical protein
MLVLTKKGRFTALYNYFFPLPPPEGLGAGLFPRPPPEGLVVVLGPFGGLVVDFAIFLILVHKNSILQ